MLALLPLRPFLPSLHRQPFLRQGPGEPRRFQVERFAPGSWRLLSQFSSLVIPFRFRAVDLVYLLCFPHPLLYQWTWTRSLQVLLGRRWAVLGAGGGGPAGVASLFPAVREFPVATETAPPGSVCSLTPGSPPDARAAPSGGVTPAAKGSLSRAGPVPSAVTLATAGVALD